MVFGTREQTSSCNNAIPQRKAPLIRKKVSIECPERAGSFVVQLNPHTASTSKREQKEKMTNRIKAIPEGHHTLTPHLVVKGASQAIEFYKKAFGAEEITRVPGPDGKSLIHAAIKIGDSRLFLVDEFPEMGSRGPHSIGGTSVTIHVYVEDVDTVFNQAVTAGAQVRMPLADMFWGDRYGLVTDPFGHSWSLATHKEDLTPEEISKRAQAAFGGCAQ
jgi:PhnB protein